MAYPYTLLQYELAPDTGGAGRWRGGTGAMLRWRVETSEIQCVTVGSGMLEETRAYGLLGAKPGSLPRMKVISRDGTQRELGVNAFHAIDEGDTFELVSQGGGGFGDPLEREPDQVLWGQLTDRKERRWPTMLWRLPAPMAIEKSICRRPNKNACDGGRRSKKSS